MRSLGLYQDYESSSRDLKRNGSQAHHLYRRHSGHGGVGDCIEGPLSGDHLPPGELGVCYKPPQVAVRTNEDDTFPRISSALHHYGAETSRRQDKEPPGRGDKDSVSQPHNSPGIIQPAGQNEHYYEGGSDGSPLLSAATSGASINAEQILSELWSSHVPLRAGEGGAPVVDNPSNKLEWAEPHRQEAQCLARDGCLANRLGSSMRGSEDEGPWSRQEQNST